MPSLKIIEEVKAVIDTNIVVSALLINYGIPHQIFQLIIKKEIINYTSNEIIEELADVLERHEIMRRKNVDERNELFKIYKEISNIVHPIEKLDIVKRDPKDNKFIEAALVANADFIISGDKDLLELISYQTIRIVSPKQFIEIFNQKHSNLLGSC